MFSRLLVISLILISVVACGGRREGALQQREWREENGKPKILTTTTMIADLVKEIGGKYVDVMALIGGQLDPHSYELVKGDDEKFAAADLIFYNGLGLEHGRSLQSNLINNSKAVAVADPIYQKDPNLILKVDGQLDPHVWMDVSLWMRTLDPIVSELVKLDPDHAVFYHKRAEKTRNAMKATDLAVLSAMQSIPEKRRYLVTSHDAFNYFGRRYLATPKERKTGDWHSRVQAPEGLSPDAELSLKDIHQVIEHVRKYQITVLFPESNLSKDALKKILKAGREYGAELYLSTLDLYGDACGEEPGAYLHMIEHNAQVIVAEIQKHHE